MIILNIIQAKRFLIMFDKKIHISESSLTGQEANSLKNKFKDEINGLAIVNQRDFNITKIHFFKPKDAAIEGYPDHKDVDLLADVTFIINNEISKKVTLKKFQNSESWHRIPNTTH